MTDDLPRPFQRLEADPEWEGQRSDVGRRRMERARQDHEEAFERLLARCRALEDEKLDWTDRDAAYRRDLEVLAAAQASSDERAAELERQGQASLDRLRASADRLEEMERRHGDALATAERETQDAREMILAIEDRHRDAAAARDEADLATARSHRAERDRMNDVHAQALAEVETREEAARHGLAKAEADFRIEAYRLSILIIVKSKEAEAAAEAGEAAAAEAAAAHHQFALLVASSSWRLTRPLRVLSRFLRRARRAPRRLARIWWSRP